MAAVAFLAGGEFVDEFSAPGTDSQAASDLLEERFPSQAGDTATIVFSVAEGRLAEPARRDAIDEALAEVRKDPEVTAVSEPFSATETPAVSPDGTVAFATVRYDAPARELGREPGERLEAAVAGAERHGIEVNRGGEVVAQAEQRAVPVGEFVGIALALIVLTIVFRSALAMAVTLTSALVALAAGMLLLSLVTAFAELPTVVPTLAVMLGLGVGIDYALMIVARHREELAAGKDPPEAARRAGSTAGVTVLTAGAIVVVAIAALLVTGIPIVARMGIGAAIMVAAVAIGAVTVLPAITGAAGRRLHPRATNVAAPRRWDRVVVRRPIVFTLAATACLLALALPATAMRLGQPDDSNDPKGSTTREAYEKLADGFGPGLNGPLQLVADLDQANAGGLEDVRRRVAATPGVAAVSEPTENEAGDAATLTVIPETSPQDERTSELVERLRDDVLPAAREVGAPQVFVGGATATFDDLAGEIADSLPLVIGLVVGLAVVFLIFALRSVVVPIVSAAFNLLAIGAAYGVIVAVFQWGWGGSLLGVTGEVPVVSFVPLLMFAILFGLSMDYNLFLQTRIREEYSAGRSAHESILVGLARTTRIILGAGAIMTAVFLGFATNPEVTVKMMGVGLATAIVVDVLLVRMVLAPAVMALLGDRAWWLPEWLRPLLSRTG